MVETYVASGQVCQEIRPINSVPRANSRIPLRQLAHIESSMLDALAILFFFFEFKGNSTDIYS